MNHERFFNKENLQFRHNGGSYSSERHPNHNDDRYIVGDDYMGVFDGLGGMEGSERAAAIVAEYCQDALNKVNPVLYEETSALVMESILYDADTALKKLTNHTQQQLATTAAISKVFYQPVTNKPYLQIAHAGDSRIYVLRSDKIVICTLDHAATSQTLPDEERRNIQNELANYHYEHEIDPYYYTHLYQRNIIGSCLTNIPAGDMYASNLIITTTAANLQPGDVALAASDGVCDNLTDTEIVATVQNESSVSELLNLARKRSHEAKEIEEPHGEDMFIKRNFRPKADDMTCAILYAVPR